MSKTTDMNPNAKLSFLERFAYGIGDYAGNLVYSAIMPMVLGIMQETWYIQQSVLFFLYIIQM